jgi:hypothetical protein
VAQGTRDSDGQTGSMQDRFMVWFRTAMWGLVFGLRALVLTMVFAAVVVGPVILTAGGVITGKSVGQTTAWVWLALNGTAPKMGAAVITLLPWGVVVVAWLSMFIAGRSLVRKQLRPSHGLIIAGAIGVLSYSLTAMFVAQTFASVEVSFDPGRAGVTTFVVTGSAMFAGVLVAMPNKPLQKLPGLFRETLLLGCAAVLTLAGIAALLLAAQLIGNFTEVMQLTSELKPGLSGFLALTFLSLGYAPVLIVWAMAYMLGAGFVIGPGSVISPFIPSIAPTQLPPFPLLAALPSEASGISWALPILAVMVGLALGVSISLRRGRENVLVRLSLAFSASLVAAIIVYLLVVFSRGNLGDVRLVDLGPNPGLSTTLTWILLTLGAAPISVLPQRVFTRRRARIEIVRVAPESTSFTAGPQVLESENQ